MKTTAHSLKTRRLLVSIASLVVITFMVIGAKAYGKQSLSDATPSVASQPVTQTSSQSTNASVSSASGNYKDGTYMATGKYNSPGGTQSIIVSLTVASNAVTSATVQPQATSGVAQLYQSDFVSGYKKFVIGKKLTDIKISRVSGSSLTSQGFANALKQIETQAKS